MISDAAHAPSGWSARVVDAALDAIFTIDETGCVTHLNRAAGRLFGLDHEQALGRSLAELIIPPDLREAHRTGLERLSAGGEGRILDRRVELRALRADGTEFPVELTVTRTAESPPRFTGFIRDLSELHVAEARRTEVERVLAAAEELAHTGSWELDLGTGRAVWSAGLYRIHGLDPEETEPGPETLLAMMHPDDRRSLHDLLEAVRADPGAYAERPLEYEYRAFRPDGSLQVIRAVGRVLPCPGGEPARWAGTEQDVTDQRSAERRLEAHGAVVRALTRWESVDEGTVDLLRRVGEAIGCPVGTLWVWSAAAGGLVCRAFWEEPGVDAGDFEVVARRTTLAPGEGAPGRAWEDGVPIAGGAFSLPGREAVGTTGLHPYVSIPANTPAGPVAVLAYYGLDPVGPGDDFLRTLTGIGEQLGDFLGRRRGQLEPQLLSPRELEVLRLAASGNTGPEIASQLSISPATIKTHFENIYEKFGVTDRAAAVAHAFRMGIIH